MDNHIKLLNKPDKPGYAPAQELMAKILVDLKRYHQEATLKLVTAVQELKVVTQAGKELKRQHQEAILEFNATVQQQHQEAKEEFNTVTQLIKATTSVDMNLVEGKGCYQSAVPEEVDTSPPKFTHWPIIDINNLPKTSLSDACHPSPGLPGF